MSISVKPELEQRLRQRAEAEGLSVDAYLDKLLLTEDQALQELEHLLDEALDSSSLEIGPGYWEEKHRRLDERLQSAKR
jgi:hypothetical protein